MYLFEGIFGGLENFAFFQKNRWENYLPFSALNCSLNIMPFYVLRQGDINFWVRYGREA